jgi:hypothetical protein
MDYWADIHPAVEVAEDMLASADGDRLPEAVQVFLLVHGAQVAIDNGGFAFFFEADWPGTPPYDDFIGAYETIECIEQAAALRRIVATFPFSEPHLHKDKRQEFMDARYDKSAFGIAEWNREILYFGKEVWENVAKYYKMHADDFA